jgi:hypothetical protein
MWDLALMTIFKNHQLCVSMYATPHFPNIGQECYTFNPSYKDALGKTFQSSRESVN